LPWDIEDNGAYFIVRDNNGQALSYVYCEHEAGRRTAAGLLTQDEARRIAINIAKLLNSRERQMGNPAENPLPEAVDEMLCPARPTTCLTKVQNQLSRSRQ
jgi:hypothetical protein